MNNLNKSEDSTLEIECLLDNLRFLNSKFSDAISCYENHIGKRGVDLSFALTLETSKNFSNVIADYIRFARLELKNISEVHRQLCLEANDS